MVIYRVLSVLLGQPNEGRVHLLLEARLNVKDHWWPSPNSLIHQNLMAWICEHFSPLPALTFKLGVLGTHCRKVTRSTDWKVPRGTSVIASYNWTQSHPTQQGGNLN